MSSAGSRFDLRRRVVVLAIVSCTASASAAPVVVHDAPPQLAFLATIGTMRKDILMELWDEEQFPDREPGPALRGQRWHLLGKITADKDVEDAWSTLKAGFLKNGWFNTKSYRHGGFEEVLHYQHKGVEAWAKVIVDGGAAPFDLSIDTLEVGPMPFALKLARPATEPEKLDGDCCSAPRTATRSPRWDGSSSKAARTS